MSRKVIHKLKLLQGIRPRPEWSSSTRDILLTQIKAQGFIHEKHSRLEPVFVYTSAGLADVYRYTIGVLFSRPRNAFATLFILVGTSVGLSFASESSLPGSTLYSVKKTREVIAVAVVSPDERAQFEVDLAERRLSELKVLSQVQNLSPEEKEKSVESLAFDVSANFDTVNRSLDSLKKNNEPKKLIAVANMVNEKAASAQKLLSEAHLPPAHQQKVEEVTQKIDETSRKALSVLVEKIDSAGLTERAITEQIGQKLDQAEQEIAALEAKVSVAGLPKDEGTTLVEKSDLAKKILDEARDLLSRKDFRVALDKLNQSKTLSASVSSLLWKAKGDADVRERETQDTQINTQADF